MSRPFIIYLKNSTSPEFEYKRDVSRVARTDKGYRVTFNSGKTYNYGADKVQYFPLLSTRQDVCVYENGNLNKRYNAVDNYGRYLIFRDKENCSYPVENNGHIEICDVKKNSAQAKSVIDYFKEILGDTGEVSFDIPSEETENKNPNQISSDILLRALDEIDLLESRSAFSHYIDGVNPAVSTSNETLIYPFGCNESQKQAVEASLGNSISIVEGPPGTGKTQTILNIIANLIVQNKTVAIVSNNNSAVFNVREKLEKQGYGMVVASLGNKNNRSSFFDNISEQTIKPDFEMSKERLREAENELRELDSLLTTCFQYRNRLATLGTELSDAEIEFSHIKAEQPLDPNIKSILDKKFRLKWDFNKALKLKELLSRVDLENKLSFMNKLRFVFQYGLFDFNSISKFSEEFPVYVNHKFYELCIAKIGNEISEAKSWLTSHDEETNLERFIEISKEVFHKEMEERLDELLERPPVYTKEDGRETGLDKLKKGIAKHRDYIFTFLANPAVPPTNNDSEKALRPAKTKLKVSGCFRSDEGAENHATVASVIQTAGKNGQNPFEVLRVIATLAQI